MRVLSLSTLFPSPVQPTLGRFVANQMRSVAETGRVDLVMLNPVGVPPWPLSRLNAYAKPAACPPTSALGPLAIYHPRFPALPGLADHNPRQIVRALLPLIRRLHADQPFDLIDAQFFFPDGPAAATIATALGIPYTIKARGSDIHYWSTRPRAHAQLSAAAANAAAILTVSAALGRNMAALGFPADRIRTHYTGLDRTRFRVTPRAEARAALDLSIPANAPLLVTPGSLIAIKGQRLAIDALTHLPTAHLALAGTGPDAEALRTHAAALGVANRVHPLGQVSHDALPTLMSAADAVVLPSEREGLANVWIEALACGTPLVIPDIGGAREVVRGATAGRIAARDGAAIADAVREVLEMGAAQDDVAATVAGFSWEENARRLIGIWEEVAGKKG